ncbi:MAG: hypothetical protein WD824_08680 [Cyclobacteriaceae bacterium]
MQMKGSCFLLVVAPLTSGYIAQPQLIFPKGEKNPNPNMAGTVWLYNLVDQLSLIDTRAGNLTLNLAHERTDTHTMYGSAEVLSFVPGLL